MPIVRLVGLFISADTCSSHSFLENIESHVICRKWAVSQPALRRQCGGPFKICMDFSLVRIRLLRLCFCWGAHWCSRNFSHLYRCPHLSFHLRVSASARLLHLSDSHLAVCSYAHAAWTCVLLMNLCVNTRERAQSRLKYELNNFGICPFALNVCCSGTLIIYPDRCLSLESGQQGFPHIL